MENIDANDLESAIGSAKGASANESAGKADEGMKLSPEEEVGFHKGALNTLMAERDELVKMIANVEAIMQAHLKRLKELGVDLEVKKE
ncbi:hypothetical protein CMI37_22410 [Candidatus Pacearchaeota archaeon]|nr:hypothetical protein [Candidatus Pacearchaeota archaeon]|tara:strand:- start:1973 stop:2236 length:264 start_codon:yes stop_codon:yes gene_type:complete